MANYGLSLGLARTWRSLSRNSVCKQCLKSRRTLTTATAAPSQDPSLDLVDSSSLAAPETPDPEANAFDPLRASRLRKRQLPPSRSVFTSSRSPFNHLANSDFQFTD